MVKEETTTISDQNESNIENENGNLDISINESNDQKIDIDDLVIIKSKDKNLLKLIKIEIEDKILSKIKHTFSNESKIDTTKTYQISFSNKYLFDKIGNSIKTGETAVCEGWNIPKYENEYQNLLGLPQTEDDPSDTMKLKKPTQECFNCLATNHKITECPIKHDQERILLNRKNFTSQSIAAHEQALLFSTRYTNDELNRNNRGFTPGKISDSLREALGLNKKQLPPYIYLMRELGYPVGWLKEAVVKKSGLNVIDGNGNEMDIDNEDIGLESGEEKDTNIEIENLEYDSEKIIDFIGFNQPVPENYIDEWRDFGVRRYTESLSKNKFLSTLRIADKKPKTRLLSKKDDSIQEISNEDVNNKQEILDENKEMNQKQLIKSIDEEKDYGSVIKEISGTPIVINISGVDKVPNADSFSIDIGDFKPYEMLNNSTGHYQKIVNLTKELKNK